MTTLSAKTFALFCLALSTLPTTAQAADPQEPAKALMAMLTRNWDEDPEDYVDYFGKEQLDTLYSEAFADAYREAAKHPAYDVPESGPFDYDPISDGQDGCPVEDTAYETGETNDGVTDVIVTFKMYGCWTNDEVYKDKVSTLHVMVVEENGKAVIDDILRDRDDGSESLVKEMQDIAKPQ